MHLPLFRQYPTEQTTNEQTTTEHTTTEQITTEQITTEQTTTEQTASIAPQPAADPIPSKEIETFVQAWASAWSSQDVDRYLDFYSDDFQPAEGKSLRKWRSERRYRVAYPAYIRVEIEDVKTQMLTPSQAEATFTQRYESNTFRDSTAKELLLERQGNEWKIVQERVRTEQ
jgi:ketosteroid isomerase-like protein